MKITPQIVAAIYAKTRKVISKEIKMSAAINSIVLNYGMKKSSTTDYVRNIIHMVRGEEYHRTMNTYGTQYILDRISKDFDGKIFENALLALDKHIVYFEKLRPNVNRSALKEILSRYKGNINLGNKYYPDEVDDDSLFEGNVEKVFVNKYERNLEARNKCIAHYGCKCIVCEFDFSKRYKDIGAGFIHVHHLKPLSTIKATYKVDPIEHLRPVCPNCHAMLHKRGGEPMSIEELRTLLRW